MMQLARYHQGGHGVPQDLVATRQWLQSAAQLRVLEAQYQLGLMLADGLGGAADPALALFWFETAASEGHVPACLATAVMYAKALPQPDTGALVPAYLAKVYLWTEAAKARGTPSQRADALKLEAQVLALMPASWRPTLDKQVAAHLARLP
jgi:TPR repeat protein